jgi:hypothetical protein
MATEPPVCDEQTGGFRFLAAAAPVPQEFGHPAARISGSQNPHW